MAFVRAAVCTHATSTRVALHHVGRLAASHTWETGSSLPAGGDHYTGCTKYADLPHDTLRFFSFFFFYAKWNVCWGVYLIITPESSLLPSLCRLSCYF